MTVSPTIWILTIVLIVGLLAFDYIFHVRKAHIPTIREAAIWSAIYVGVALLFGVGVFVLGDSTMGTEYFAGYVTEKALSVDNLFVFLVIMSAFSVPREDQQKVLLFGITFAIIARTGMILAGAAAIEAFAWAFYIFGAILLYTAAKMLLEEFKDEEKEQGDALFVRLVKKVLPATDEFDGDRLFTIENGKRVLTPMLLVMIAIGGTDLLFALDSVPAIFGLTQNTYIVFTATVFSLLGLRQLYFLIDGLLDRLVYLSYGLSLILAFIGVKLVIHALHENDLGFINGGEPVHAIPEITTSLSLTVIIGVLTITVLASLMSPKGRAQAAVNDAHREAQAYLEMTYAEFERKRDAMYDRMIAHEKIIDGLPERFQGMVVAEKNVRELLADAHLVHDRRTEFNERGERSDEQPDGLVVTRPDGTVATDPSGTVITVAREKELREAKEAKRREREQARAEHAAARD
ncbi:TerC/Alx family metal homeostasis membrane protein [Brachybacterium saurashtrense]|uniref:TerC family protein n=1 Tax=Brachybacterium saurashtrense TaxID=556288 RepID=A0A345YP06_9MICO|nr:TerC/Alx family metal homeostasis membrane protein [Brachybacterium saurashtrense]AXK45658.1 TerC family protein [Brachybacterium saurashtrense]RRR24675.1 TerC family protein [Brachybacterium saurashtrense]